MANAPEHAQNSQDKAAHSGSMPAKTSETALDLYDVIVIGGGPAGLTAAIYLARARHRVLVLEKEQFGGQISTTGEVANYPGVLATSGAELAEIMHKQAEGFGAEFLFAEATSLDMDGDIKTVHTTRGDFSALCVLLATGASPRRLGFDGEDDYRGYGVAYCATCDGAFFTDKEVLVVGGGYAAAEESVFLTRYAKRVTIIIRRDRFSCPESVAERAKEHPKIDVRFNTRVVRVAGDTALRSAVLENTKTGERETWRPEVEGENFGLFVLSGTVPSTQLLEGIAKVDDNGYAVIDENYMTTCPGLFAAGDVCKKSLRQMATAVGQAANATAGMDHFIQEAQKKTGLSASAAKKIAKETGGTTVSTAAQTSVSDSDSGAKDASAQARELFGADAFRQIEALLAGLETSLVLKLTLNDMPVSQRLRDDVEALESLSDKLSVEILKDPSGEDTPKMEVYRTDGTWTGLAFHGAPNGHEAVPFVMGLYNVAGPGQAVSDEEVAAIEALKTPLSLQVVVSPSCPMCPDLVMAAQHIAALKDGVTARVYDVTHFPNLQAKYNIMSVPCLIVNNGETVAFGRKQLGQLLELLKG